MDFENEYFIDTEKYVERACEEIKQIYDLEIEKLECNTEEERLQAVNYYHQCMNESMSRVSKRIKQKIEEDRHKAIELYRLETDKMREETDKMKEETDKMREETDKMKEETDKMRRENEKRRRENEKRRRENEARSRENEARFRELEKMEQDLEEEKRRVELDSNRKRFFARLFINSDHFLHCLNEAQFDQVRSQFKDTILTTEQQSNMHNNMFSSIDAFPIPGVLTASVFNVNMLSHTQHKLHVKQLIFKDLENTIQTSLFYNNHEEMESFIDVWSNILEDIRCAMMYCLTLSNIAHDVLYTQSVIQKFLEGMIEDLRLPGSITINNKTWSIDLDVSRDEYASLIGLKPTDVILSNRPVIPVSAKVDLMFNLFSQQSTENISHFETKKTAGIEHGNGMGPREQVIASNLALAAEGNAHIVRGMVLNVFVGSLVWFVAPDDNDKPLTKGVHYIEHRVYNTRDIVIRILACLMEISKDQMSSLMEWETAQTIVFNEEGCDDWEFRAEDAGAAKRGSDTAQGGARSMGGSFREAAFPFGLSSERQLRKRSRAGNENQCPQSRTFGPYLSASELEKLGTCRKMDPNH